MRRTNPICVPSVSSGTLMSIFKPRISRLDLMISGLVALLGSGVIESAVQAGLSASSVVNDGYIQGQSELSLDLRRSGR